jgi:hypothetical protein
MSEQANQTLLPELAHHLSRRAPGLALLRYKSIHALRALLAELPQPIHQITYRPRAQDERASAFHLVQRCQDLARSGIPAIFLCPDPDTAASTDLEAQAVFWKNMNAQREALGALSAQIILTLDEAQTAACFHHAKDLVSWCSPKFELATPVPPGSSPGNTRISVEKTSQDAALSSSLTWQSLYPLLQRELESGRPLAPQAIDQLLLPLMRHAVENGAVTLAHQLLPHGDHAAYADERSRSLWLELKGELAVTQGDLAGALRYFSESKTIRERLAASDPANAAWQRDLWVSYWRLADLCEKSSEAAQAGEWWRKAYDTLSGMKERGLHVSPEDLGFLERLRQKAGKR